jgi:MFS superfamily sulfate permease-like transporter
LGPEFAVLLCFLSGCVELLMGILQLGKCTSPLQYATLIVMVSGRVLTQNVDSSYVNVKPQLCAGE